MKAWTWDTKERRNRVLAAWVAGIVLFAGSFSVGSGIVTRAVGPSGGGAGPAPEARPTGQAALIEQIKDQVAELRGLEWKKRLDVEVLPRAEVTRRLLEANEEDDPEPAVSDEELLELLGLIPEEVDLEQAVDDLSAAQVVGFYDPETKEIVVADVGGQMDPRTMMTIAHELDHALVDQHFGFGARLEQLADEERSEEAAALRALVEGEARLLEYAWAGRYLTEEEQVVGILGGFLGTGEEDEGPGEVPARRAAELPPFLRESSRFPYDAGHDFVEKLYEWQGWQGINRAYGNPPRSTAEILDPERYPAEIDHPPLPAVEERTSCTVARRGTLGTFDVTQMLEMQPSAAVAEEATRGWRGDTFGAARCGSGLGLLLRWRASDAAGAERLVSALRTWARGWSQAIAEVGPDGRFTGRRGAGRIVREGDVVSLVISRDRAVADRLVASIG